MAPSMAETDRSTHAHTRGICRVLTVAAAAAAGYQFAQLVRCMYCSSSGDAGAMAVAWTSFLLDKVSRCHRM
jgi:hypothetical protein